MKYGIKAPMGYKCGYNVAIFTILSSENSLIFLKPIHYKGCYFCGNRCRAFNKVSLTKFKNYIIRTLFRLQHDLLLIISEYIYQMINNHI